uniref:Uncharacterized protein n=1 Tax=uncultured bacterium contig00014 TaxID=1181505 RepID=A0A806KFC3_9BACT|nr:hypothetical protein [uncultured bacterium contig00014]
MSSPFNGSSTQTAYFAEKLSEAEYEAAKPNAVWLDENEFWSGDDLVNTGLIPCA